jgi:hypothetical protein
MNNCIYGDANITTECVKREREREREEKKM